MGRISNEEKLRRENEELKKRLEQLESKPIEAPKIQYVNKFVDQDYVDIPANKRIRVVSLCDGVLVLTAGDPRTPAKRFIFNKFGDVHTINYSELETILHWHNSFVEKGYFYIDDVNVVANHGLVEIYKNMIDKNTVENFLGFTSAEIKTLFPSLPVGIQSTIVDLLSSKIFNNQEVDLNKIDLISSLYGINIRNKGKAYNEFEENE